jgi:hypothetical protein
MTDTTPPAEDYSSLSPELAAEKLVAISSAYRATQTKTLHDLSPEEAGQRLAEMGKAYQEANKPKNSAAHAAALGDDPTPPREFETTSWPKQNTRNKLSTADMLADVGIPPEGVARILAGKGYSREDYDAAIRWRQRAESDPLLRQAILSGDRAARHVLTAMSAIISMGPGE